MSTIPDDIQTLLKDAYAALDDGDLDRAVDLGEALLSRRHVRGFEILGLALDRQGDLDEAIDILKEGVGAAPDAFPLWELFGNVLSKKQMFEEAQQAYQRAIECPNADVESVKYNFAVMWRNAGHLDRALTIATQISSPKLAVRANTLRTTLLNSMGMYEDCAYLANAVINQIMNQDEMTDEDMKDLAQTYAELGRSYWLGRNDKQSAFENSWKALEWERSDPSALWLIRELIGRKSPASRWYRLDVQGKWYFPLEQNKDAPTFSVSYDIVADNEEEALMFAKHLEPPEIRDSMNVISCEDRGQHSNHMQGLYWRSNYNFNMS